MAIKIQVQGNYLHVLFENGLQNQTTNELYFPKLYSYFLKNYLLSPFDVKKFDDERASLLSQHNAQVNEKNDEFKNSRTEITNEIVNSRSYKERAELLEKLDELTAKHNQEILNLDEQYESSLAQINAEQEKAQSEHVAQVHSVNLINAQNGESLSLLNTQFESGEITDLKGGTVYTLLSFVDFLTITTSGEVSVMPPFEQAFGDQALQVRVMA